MKKIILCVLSFVGLETQASSWESLVERLTTSRSEIEVLSQDLESLQKEKQSELDQLLIRKADLDSNLEKEKLRRLQLTEKLKRLEGRVRIIAKSDPKAHSKLEFWINDFITFVNESIPFEKENRLKILENLKIRLNQNHEPMEYIMSDLWNFIEGEFKLSATNEYKIITLDFKGQKKKSEVARLGLMTLFAVTPDGKIHQAIKSKNEWSWQDIQASTEKNSILSLVKNLKNKNSVEIYQLPMGHAIESSKSSVETSMHSKKQGVSL